MINSLSDKLSQRAFDADAPAQRRPGGGLNPSKVARRDP
jgi:hypothetical protein